MRRVIGMDIHRTFTEVVFWEDGRLRWYGRVDMTRAGLEGFGRSLTTNDEVVIEATGNAMAVVRVLGPYVARVIIANPLQVKAIAHAHVKTDKIDAGVLASLHAAGFLPEVWLPDAETERRRRLVARRNQVVRHRTRVKNETHAILAAHLIPPCPHAELFNGPGAHLLPDDERAAIARHLRELDRLGEDLATLDRDIGAAVVDQPAVRRLLTSAGMNVTVAAGLVKALRNQEMAIAAQAEAPMSTWSVSGGRSPRGGACDQQPRSDHADLPARRASPDSLKVARRAALRRAIATRSKTDRRTGAAPAAGSSDQAARRGSPLPPRCSPRGRPCHTSIPPSSTKLLSISSVGALQVSRSSGRRAGGQRLRADRLPAVGEAADGGPAAWQCPGVHDPVQVGLGPRLVGAPDFGRDSGPEPVLRLRTTRSSAGSRY